MSIAATELRSASDEQLAAWYEAGEAEAIREAARRDRLDAQRKTRAAERGEWECAAHAQYLAAESGCRGNLVRRGSPVTDAWALWSGSDAYAMANASEELRNWWLDHPRVTVTAYRGQISNGRRIQRDERDAADQPQAAREGTMGALGMAGHVARDVGRVAEHGARLATREALYQQRLDARQQQVTQRAQAMRGGDVAVKDPAAPDRTRAPLDGNLVLGHAAQHLGTYVRYPNLHSLVTATLWAAHCHNRDDKGVLLSNATGRLALTSADGDSGKSQAMETIASICPEAYGLTLRVSEAGLVQAISRHETLFLDEADGLFGNSARAVAVRTILNGGYTRQGTILNGKGDKNNRVSVFGPIAFGGLESVLMSPREDMRTLRTRCIIIRMEPSEEDIPEWPPQDTRRGDLIRDMLRDWTYQQRSTLTGASPVLPDGVRRRKAQMWRPLIAIADAAGGNWPEAARIACEEMCAGAGAADGLEELEEMGYAPFDPLGADLASAVVHGEAVGDEDE